MQSILWMDLSEERKDWRWQLSKVEGLAQLKGGVVLDVFFVSLGLQGGHPFFPREEDAGKRLKCDKRYLQTAN